MTGSSLSIDEVAAPCRCPSSALALLLAVTLSSCGGVAEAGEGLGDPSDRLFSTERLLEVVVEMDPDDLEVMRREGRTLGSMAEGCADGPSTFPWTSFMATATIDGERVDRVGIRKKGYIGSLLVSRPSIKLRFNQHVQRQQVLGMGRLTLNNNRQDPSNIYQCIGYKVFADAGVPTSRCGFAHVTVNGEDMGVYTTLETYDRDFLARHFPSADGKLYEGQLSDFRPNWVETFENKLQDGFDDRRELYELTRALRADDEDLLELLEPLVDLDAYLSFWAAESLLGHWDGYNGNQNNFFLYLEPTSRKFYFIPWGTDGVFGLNPFLPRPTPVSVNAFGMLPNRLYGLPEFRARYFERLRELLDTVWDEEALLAEVDGYVSVLPESDPTMLEAARTFIRERRDLIEAELSEGDPVWDFPLNPDDRCFHTQPEMSATFSTTWGSAAAVNPFEQGEAELNIVMDGEQQTFIAQTAIAGRSPEFFNSPSVTVLGLRADGSIVAVLLAFEDFEFAPGPAQFHGAATFGGVQVIVNGAPQGIAGALAGGTLQLEAASMEDGAPVIGEVRGPWMSR